MKESFAVLILAGGKGLRMGASLPKQFIEINGKPILFYTLEAFIHYKHKADLFLVLPKEQIEYWNTITENWKYKEKITIVKGGSERFFSVKNGLEFIKGFDNVIIHDGVRPMLSEEFLDRVFAFSKEQIGAIPTVELVDSIRKIEKSHTISVNRSEYVAVQTPQIFCLKTIKEAYSQEFSVHFTDDASVLESYGKKIQTFKGERGNKKITTREDLEFARLFLK